MLNNSKLLVALAFRMKEPKNCLGPTETPSLLSPAGHGSPCPPSAEAAEQRICHLIFQSSSLTSWQQEVKPWISLLSLDFFL